MFQADGNPDSNCLKGGVTDAQLDLAVRMSGYPLQRVIAEQLLGEFDVTEEWGYVDRETAEHRALDIFASKRIRESAHFWFDLALLVECKKSDLPFVFFEAAAPQAPREFPIISGLGGKSPELHVTGVGSTSTSVSRFLGLHDFPFVSSGPPTCSAFARAERKGKELDLSGTVPFNQVVLPLVSAVQHFANLQKTVSMQGRVPACLVHPICVLDAAMVLVQGGPELPRLMLCPWVRIVRQEATKEGRGGFWRHYVVDFIHRGYLETFVHQHLIPFADQFADRAISVELLLCEGKGRVPDFDAWKFEDLRPVEGTG